MSLPTSALAIVNARIWTGDRRRPWADAVLVRDERLEIVGASAEVKKRTGAGVTVLDAKGMMMTPGFTDGATPSVARIQAAIIQRTANADSGESEMGVLAPGTLADLVLVDRDVTRVAAAELHSVRVVLTIVRGRVVYDPDGLMH